MTRESNLTEEDMILFDSGQQMVSVNPYSPNTPAQGLRLAEMLSSSRIVPESLRNDPGSIYIVLARSHALGIDWSIGLTEIHVIKGRVSYSANLLSAMCESDPAFEYFEIMRADDQGATAVAKKLTWEEPKEYSVTIEDARRAGYLDGKHSVLWRTRPRIMLGHMAAREASREWNKTRLLGMYGDDEVSQVINVTADSQSKSEVKRVAVMEKMTEDIKEMEAALPDEPATEEFPETVEAEVVSPPVAEVPEEEDLLDLDAEPNPLVGEEQKQMVRDFVGALKRRGGGSGNAARQKEVWSQCTAHLEAGGYSRFSEMPASEFPAFWKLLNDLTEEIK